MSRAFYLCGLSAALLLCLGTVSEAGLFGHHRATATGVNPPVGLSPLAAASRLVVASRLVSQLVAASPPAAVSLLVVVSLPAATAAAVRSVVAAT